MTVSYSPDTAIAVSIGATSAGWCDGPEPPWDNDLVRYNLRAVEQRVAALALDRRDADLATRALVRQAAGQTLSPVRILAVGDSITAGVGSSDGSGWRGWLADHADRAGTDAAISTVAVGGGTLRTLAPQVPAALVSSRPEIVLLGVGVNDAAQPDLATWGARHLALVDQILASSPPPRVACALLPTPPASVGPWVGNIATVNTAVRATVSARQSTGRVRVADMTRVPASWTTDGVHPLDAGHLHWARAWMAAIGDWLPGDTL